MRLTRFPIITRPAGSLHRGAGSRVFAAGVMSAMLAMDSGRAETNLLPEPAKPTTPAETPEPARKPLSEADLKRLEWFKEARFGMFIHWGVYSVAGGSWNGTPASGTSDWLQNWVRIPAAEYRTALQNQFNPTAYDPESWVLAAKKAGMKYVVITAKHHDGFCLWDSKLTDWDVGSTPYGKDLLKPLAEACRKHGMKFGLFYSILDWSHPDYGDKDRAVWRGNANNPAPDMDRYTAYMKGQLEELLEDYKDVAVLWFDGEWETSWTKERAANLYDHLRQLKPSLLINDRLDRGRFELPTVLGGREFRGDFATPEESIPVNSQFVANDTWEYCTSINESWGYKKSDHRWKSAEELLHTLVDVASKGGNLLLNVGPNGDGKIPAEALDRLAAIGTWMEANGEALHGTSRSSFTSYSWDGCSTTRREADGSTRLFLHLYSWPENGILTVRGLKDRPKAVRLLGSPVEVGLSGAPDAWRIELPANSTGQLMPVVELKFDVPPVMLDAFQTVGEDGSLVMGAVDAIMSSRSVSWKIKLPAGEYDIAVQGSCAGHEGKLTMSFGGAKWESVFPQTKDWKDFKAVSCGRMTVPRTTEGEFIIGLEDIYPKAIFSVGAVHMVPVVPSGKGK